jgi:hypothetical protein
MSPIAQGNRRRRQSECYRVRSLATTRYYMRRTMSVGGYESAIEKSRSRRASRETPITCRRVIFRPCYTTVWALRSVLGWATIHLERIQAPPSGAETERRAAVVIFHEARQRRATAPALDMLRPSSSRAPCHCGSTFTERRTGHNVPVLALLGDYNSTCRLASVRAAVVPLFPVVARQGVSLDQSCLAIKLARSPAQ